MRLPGLGPKTARRIWQELGITTVAELRGGGRRPSGCATSAGSAPKSEEKILAALAKPQAADGAEAGAARLGAAAAARARSRRSPSIRPRSRVSIAGSARRFRETVRDLDLIATATDAAALLDAFCELPWVVEVAARGGTKATVIGQDGLRFDLRVVPPESYGNLLQHFTGSKEHNVALREAAVRRGLSVSEYGDHRGRDAARCTRSRPRRRSTASSATTGSRPSCARTAASSRRRGRATLPDLVELGDLRGDLHTHTTWSDGKDSLEAMVAEAIARGYDYYAICDHSHRLRDGRLEQQAEAIDRAERARADPAPEGDRGQHPRRRRARRPRRRSSPALDWVVASVAPRASTTTRPGGCSPRWRTPTSTASAT